MAEYSVDEELYHAQKELTQKQSEADELKMAFDAVEETVSQTTLPEQMEGVLMSRVRRLIQSEDYSAGKAVRHALVEEFYETR